MSAVAETERADELLQRAMQLSPTSRDRIAIGILDSLLGPTDDGETLRTAWRDELDRRIGDIEAGTIELLDADAALDALEKRYREKHGR
jgi:putative addiction module component (TIGR02574 family)